MNTKQLKKQIMEAKTDEEKMEAVKRYLEAYRTAEDFLKVYNYSATYDRMREEMTERATEMKQEKNEILSWVESVRPRRAYLFLFYIYIMGKPITFVSERMEVSRRTAYRMLSEGLLTIAKNMQAEEKAKGAPSIFRPSGR